MWTEKQLIDFTKQCETKYDHTPSAIVLKSYILNSGWRFDKMRAFVAQQIQIIRQK